MIERLLPPMVVSVEAYSDRPGEPAFPGEQDLIADAVEVRRREFITARRCAREALERLGHPSAPIRPGSRREPQWPPGVVGSITHCVGYRSAAVVRRCCVAGIGIDAEPHGPVPAGVLKAVAGSAELTMLARLGRIDPAVHWDRLLFSAKESIYKAWYPLTGRWLGFEHALLMIDPVAQAFTGHLLVDGERTDGGLPLTEMRGRYLVERDLVVTSVNVPVSRSA